MASVSFSTVRELIAALNALPEDQKDLPVSFQTTVDVNQEVVSFVLGAADYGQQIILSS